MRCEDCACLDKRSHACKVFLELQDNCPICTKDADYIRKIDDLTEHYAGYLKIRQYMREQKKTRKKRAKEKSTNIITEGDVNC
jgi:hypothetical protein